MRSIPLNRRVLAVAVLVSLVALPGRPIFAQAPKAPAPAPKKTPAPAKPAAQPAAKPAPPKVAEKAPAPSAPKAPADVQFKSKYTTGDQVTESVTYLQGARERYELADMILLRQHDQKRTVQISRASNTYLVTPEGISTTQTSVDPAAAARPAGVVMVATSIVDTGERKTTFGQE